MQNVFVKIKRKILACSFYFGVFGLIFLCSCSKPAYKNKFVISGTYLEIISPYKEAANIVYEEFKRLDKIFNLYDSNSEIYQLNNTYNLSRRVSDEMIEILKLSGEISELTGGAFDISCGVLYDFWKKLTTGGRAREFPADETIEELKKMCGMEYIEVNFKEKTVLIKKRGLKIDLGGIAKGYMVDRAAIKLKEAGIDSALISAGGDMYCLGRPSLKDRHWRVGIKNPEEIKGVVDSQDLMNEAIATSGSYEQFFEYKGERYSHLIDPRTGYPVNNNAVSVSVISKNCTTADSLATAFFILGKEGVNKFLSKNLSTMRVIMLTSENEGKHIHFFK